MPLPGLPSERRPMSMDELIAQMNSPRQEFEIPVPAEPREPVPIPGDRSKIDPFAEEKVSQETAAAAGRQIAGLVVNGTQALCGLIGGEKSEKYKATASQQRDLADSYAKVAAFYNMSEANPVLAAVILTIVILAPGFKDAFSDRRMKKIEEEQKRQSEEQSRQRAEMEYLREQISKETEANEKA